MQLFEDEMFDIVLTQEVLEHVNNPDKCFREIARTLKVGGYHIFTGPLVNKFKKTERWAKEDTGRVKFLKQEEWHGNPLLPGEKKGSAVFFHFGYDIVDFIKETSGLNTSIEYIYNLDSGICGEYIEVLVSKKVKRNVVRKFLKGVFCKKKSL